MSKYDLKVDNCKVYECPIETRVPLKFGPEVTTFVYCARAIIYVSSTDGRHAEGVGETPLSVAWVWPDKDLSFFKRANRLRDFCVKLGKVWSEVKEIGHAMEIGHTFINTHLKELFDEENSKYSKNEEMPWLAALVCNSTFDLALHDAYGNLNQINTWKTYNKNYMNHDLSWFYSEKYKEIFKDKYPEDYFARKELPTTIPVWHLVGAKDAIFSDELKGDEIQDGYPLTLVDWIKKDGLKCLKIKLTGNNEEWDYKRIITVGKLSIKNDVNWLSVDFNCTVKDPSYVCKILDKLLIENPRIYGMILYVEQPFPYELRKYSIDVHSVSARKPLFMDESAHDWQHIELGRNLGWSSVALKTCKTLTGAILSMCWAKQNGMTLMVQDLTNPMLAQLPHVQLAAYAGTIMGVESNAMQFYPKASWQEERIHPGLFSRKDGTLNLTSISGNGLGYRLKEIEQMNIEAKEPEKWKKIQL